jgi:hypothetical protein
MTRGNTATEPARSLSLSKGRSAAHLASLGQAQRPCGHHAEIAPSLEEPAARVLVAAALSREDGQDVIGGTPRSPSLSKGAMAPTLRRFDKLSGVW